MPRWFQHLSRGLVQDAVFATALVRDIDVRRTSLSVCTVKPNHQMNGDSNAAFNILYIGLYMMVNGGTFPLRFVIQ
ncbi:hypothetical protein MP228_004942 [Amoeboaphelidium protococcarum]|nr:hypothetical protein MP228_004942 [Amoeboaphelidium protococcarum]